MRMKLLRAAVLLVVCLSAVRPASAAGRTPRLVVLLVVDQMRADYVDRYGDRWTHGLRRLVDEGAWFRQAEYPYSNTVTCAGHATVSTGSLPSVHGMIGNSWWDRALGREVTCASDESATIVSFGQPLAGTGESAHALRVPTLADVLRAELPESRSVAFSLKARTAVTLVGQRPDAAMWFDDRGEWVTSSAYASEVPAAVCEYVRAHPVAGDFGRTWDRLLPADRYLFEPQAIGVVPKSGMTARFPHALNGATGEPDAAFFSQWQSSPFADAYLADMALSVAKTLKLGSAGDTDFLAIGFSTLDKVGHDFGPRSHEIQDVLLRLDGTLGTFFDGLDALVGKDNYVVALTADHGVAPIPEAARIRGLESGRVAPATIAAAVEQALAALGPGEHVRAMVNGDVYLAPGVWSALRRSPSLLQRVRDRVTRVPGVLELYTRDQIAADAFDDDPVGRRLAHSYDAERSGDLSVVLKPYWLASGSGTSHGTPFGYDARVPLFLMGKGIAAGEYLQPAAPTDIAPTLAFLSGITLPRAHGRVLTEAIK